ncbi:MAG: ATP-dependent helicase [Candidatus Peribacteraceae bacterium]|nr:ATP-dependent helicase [Candidatus Peribacteraceae bacterium]
MSTFDTQFARLNPAQKKAVETIEGPVMVVAGPGTGKTQVVSMRVANILKRTQMKPYNILCLTFSVSGATAMRERLRSLIGPDAYGVNVSTIHGFCNTVLQSHPEVFDDFAQINHVTQVQQYQLMNQLIDKLPVSAAIVSPKNRYDRTGDILSRVSQIKREGISVDQLRKVAKEYREEMETKSKPHTKTHQRNLRMAKQYEEFVELCTDYQQLLKEKNVYDFDDMLLFVIKALQEEDWLLASLQERYQYILVDEYQDTNGAQNMLLQLLTTPPEGSGLIPNIFVVGDDDQAIYRFQGANVEGMLQFTRRFSGMPIITLDTSYRSTQPILDAAALLIANNTDRLVGKVPGVEKNIHSGLIPPDGISPVLMRPVSDAVEPLAIAEKINDLHEQGVDYSEIAIFTRTNHELFPIHEMLSVVGIPAQITGKLDLLQQPKVREALTLLKAVYKPTEDSFLSAALSIPSLGCHPADLGALWAQSREENYARKNDDKSWRPLLDFLVEAESRAEALALRNSDALLRARDLILTLHERNKQELTLPALTEKLLRESGLLPLLQEEVMPLEFIALQEFFEHIKTRCHENLDYGLTDLLRDIDYRDQYGLRLTYAIPHMIDDAVQLMTAHASKGLEFEAVFISNFREKHWDHKRGGASLALPDHLLFSTSDDDSLSLQDERRLTFVALTRAKKYLFLSCPERITRGDREQDVSPSQFFAEAGKLPEQKYDVRDPASAATLLRPTLHIDIDEALQTYLRKKLETFELSVTALNNFLADPQKFLWEDLLSSPKAKQPQFAYGSAVHSALRDWGRSVQKNEPLQLDPFMDAFRSALIKNEILTERDRRLWLHIGDNALPKYYSEWLTIAPIIGGLEKKLSGRLDDIRLKGILDRFDLYHETGANVHIIDYKTGTPKTEKQVKEDYGGSTYRQLVFYKLLTQISPDFGGYEATEFTLDFIGEQDHEPKRLTFEIPDVEVHELKELIRKVWAKILALDFSPLI